jgi:hypothetical protein
MSLARMYRTLLIGLLGFGLAVPIAAWASVDEMPAPINAIDAVSRARDFGEIGAREAVLAKAALLSGTPGPVPTARYVSLAASPSGVVDPCGTAFYKEVHQAYDLLTDDDKAYLKGVNPDLAVIIEARENARAGLSSSALPVYPDLDQEEPGNHCIVHYANAGANAVPDATYPVRLRKYIDASYDDMVGMFRAPLAEGDGKLHIYIVSMPGTWGVWVDVTSAGADKMKGYIKLSNNFMSKGDTWKKLARGTAYHEYFHGIQSAYNAWSDLWFMEGTCTWAGAYYGGDWVHLKDPFGSPDSLFNRPNYPLWVNEYRKYSVGALAFYFSDRGGGAKFFKSYFTNSIAERDAIKLLNTTLAPYGTTFTEQYPKFWMAMYTKKITSIKAYMPAVKIQTTHNAYGLPDTAGTVYQTGANLYEFKPQAGARPATFIASYGQTVGTPGPSQGYLFKGKNLTPNPFTAGKAFFKNFGNLGLVKNVVMVVTDTAYAGQNGSPRTYKYSAIVPDVKIISVDAESPITSGSYSTMTITYDLTGTVAGQLFPVDVKIVEIGPDVSDNASGTYDYAAGLGRTTNFYFNTSYSTVGLYRFAFVFKVPPLSWGMPQMISNKGRCWVRVNAPALAGPDGLAAPDDDAIAVLSTVPL